MGGSDVRLNFDSGTMSFSCNLTVEKSALFKADYGELCKVGLSYDPDSSTVSSKTRDFCTTIKMEIDKLSGEKTQEMFRVMG